MTKKQNKITGARSLSNSEIELINEIRTVGAELLALQDQVRSRLLLERQSKQQGSKRIFREHRDNAERLELERFERAEPLKWVAISRTEVQKGIMSLVRAVEQPAD